MKEFIYTRQKKPHGQGILQLFSSSISDLCISHVMISNSGALRSSPDPTSCSVEGPPLDSKNTKYRFLEAVGGGTPNKEKRDIFMYCPILPRRCWWWPQCGGPRKQITGDRRAPPWLAAAAADITPSVAKELEAWRRVGLQKMNDF